MLESPASAPISEDDIRVLVDAFYGMVRQDPVLGPLFRRHIGEGEDAWAEHLATLRSFWSSVMLGSGRYKGDPFQTHLLLEDLEPDMFERWLGLFGEACATLFPDARSTLFREKAERIAQSLRQALFGRLPPSEAALHRNGIGPSGRGPPPRERDR